MKSELSSYINFIQLAPYTFRYLFVIRFFSTQTIKRIFIEKEMVLDLNFLFAKREYS